MRKHKIWTFVVLLTLGQATQAEGSYKDYRLGNYKEAFNKLESRPKKDAVVDFYLGRMYLHGYGALRNEALAIKNIEKSASRGYLPAQMYMGRYELHVKKNPENAYKWFKKAAQEGDRDAQLYVIAASRYGFGTRKNPDGARMIFINAAKAGNPLAQYALAKHFLNGRYSSNRRLGIIWLKKSAEEGNNPQALTLLGKYYIQGRHVKRSPIEGEKYLKKAAEQNYLPAMVLLGKQELKYSQPKLAEHWFKRAAALNSIEAKYLLAGLYLDKKSPLYDAKTGFLKTLEIAQENYKPAQKQLAKLYQEGIGTKANEELSKQWLQKAKEGKENTLDTSVKVARWLSNHQRDTLDMPAYQIGGVFGSWNNKAYLRDNISNHAPIIETINRKDLFKPQFKYAEPNQVPINQIYDALVKNDLNKADNHWSYPFYPLSKQLESELIADSYAVRYHDQVLPYHDGYNFEEEPDGLLDMLTSWSEYWEDNTNLVAIFNHLYRKAILGNARAQFRVGQMFQYGIGVSKSKFQAITFYEKAAKQQYLPAQYSMAVLYLQQAKDPEDFMKGVRWLRDAAFKGNSYAQYVMAHLLKESTQLPAMMNQDNQQSLSMLYLSAVNGYGHAEYELAENLMRQRENGLTVAQRQAQRKLVRELYNDAVKKGVAKAALPLAYFNAMDSDPKRQEQAFKTAKIQAQANEPWGKILLGLLYDRGIGVKADHAKAIEWYQSVPDNLITQFIMGTNYLKGNGVYEDKSKGKMLLTQSSHQSFSYADYNLAILAKQSGEDFMPELVGAYHKGNSLAGILLADYVLAQNNGGEGLNKARSIYLGLAQAGDALAQLKLAFMFDKGISVLPNAKFARQWYLKSAKQGNALAQYQLAQLYQLGKLGRPNYSRALTWYKRAADENLPDANVAIGFINETVFDRYSKALKAYDKAMKAGDNYAAYNLGLMYEYGKGTEVDYKKAKALFEQAANANIPQAMTRLAGLYFNGLGVKRNADQALNWYKKAAERSELIAIYKLGLLSETGVATKLDYQKALSYYRRAAERGNEKAMMALARMYQYGIGVSKNEQKAMEIYQKLADKHHAYAQYQLGSFYLNRVDMEDNQKIAKQLLEKASKNGSQEAQKLLRSMEAQERQQVSFIEPALINLAPSMDDQPAHLIYFDAMAEWNRGDEVLSRMILQRLIEKFPNYMPAKKVYKQLNNSLGKKSIS